MMKMASSLLGGPFLVKVGREHAALKNMTVPSLQQASSVCLNYIADDEVGAQSWAGGEVVSESSGLCVAVIDYEGRAWLPGSVRGAHGQAIPDNRVELDLDA